MVQASLSWYVHSFHYKPQLSNHISCSWTQSHCLWKHNTVSMWLQACQVQIPALYVAYIVYIQSWPSWAPQEPKILPYYCTGNRRCATSHEQHPTDPKLCKGYDNMQALPYNEGHSFINETLMSHGLLGTGPVQPVLLYQSPLLNSIINVTCAVPNSVSNNGWRSCVTLPM